MLAINNLSVLFWDVYNVLWHYTLAMKDSSLWRDVIVLLQLKGYLFSRVPQSEKKGDLDLHETSQSLHYIKQTLHHVVSKSHWLTTLYLHLIHVSLGKKKVLLQITIPFPQKTEETVSVMAFRRSLVQGRLALSLPLPLLNRLQCIPSSDPSLPHVLPISFLPLGT